MLPTSEKIGYFSHESIRQLWQQASLALQAATEVYCVGYALPPTDLGIRFFLQYSRPNAEVPLFVVNRAGDVVSRFNCFLGNAYSIQDKFGESGVENFVKSHVH